MLLNIYRNKIIDGYFLFCYLLLKVGWRVSVSWIQNKKIQILNNYINSALFKSYMKKIKKKIEFDCNIYSSSIFGFPIGLLI